MSRTLHPALRTGAATALALALTATTVLPATAMPVVPDTAGIPVASTTAEHPAGEPAADPAVATGQEASEVKGAQEESLSLGGIDAEALPEVLPDAQDLPEAPEADQEPEAEQKQAPTEEAEGVEGTDEAEEADAALMSLTEPAGASAVTAQKPADSASQPSDVVIQDLQEKAQADPATLDAPAAEEAEELTDTVMDNALSATQDVEVEKIATLTQPVETMDFIVAGVTWDIEDAGQVTEVSLRVRENAEWTDWNSMEIHSGDEMPNADRVGTEPLISSGADAIQVRVTTVDGENPSGLKLDLIDPGTADTDGKLEPASPASPALQQIEGQAGLSTPEPTEAAAASTSSAPAGAEFVPAVHAQQGLITGTAQATTASTGSNALKPAIITRAQWGANESVVNDWGTPSKDLKAMYVHHTAGSNNYSASGAYAQIRGIFTYHAVNLAWGDIGYQFLVDKYGKIYQGRRGSIDAPVVGAQAGGFNTDTIGVSAMGNYDVASAPAAMVRAIERVLAWQAHRYDVDPTANTRLTQSGKGTARWSSGTTVTVPTILGHKVTNMTACPGRYLDAQLPTIRRNVDRMVANAEQNQAPGQPSLPSNPYRLTGTGTQAHAYWNAVPGADEYQIMYRAVPQGGGSISSQQWIAGKTGTATNYLLTNAPGETAQYAVRAVRNGVAGPQTYLGQHTAPLSWDDGDVYFGNGTTRSNGGIQADTKPEAIRIEGAGQADRVVVTATVASGTADIRVERDGKFAGRMKIRAGGSTVCAVPLGAGSNVRLELQNNATVTYSSVALTRPGQSQDVALDNARCQASFGDVNSSQTAFNAVEWMQWSGLTHGYEKDNTFGLYRDISRGESVAFLYRYLDPSFSVPSKAPFGDVAKGSTFFEPISWAARNGVAQGYIGGGFGVSQSVTRGEFASFLYRAVKPRFSVPSKQAFSDVSTKSSHHAAIAWMKSQKLSTGYADGTYRSGQRITRGEAALLLHRYHLNK
ncbi:S-layer homology domain-containing protein [Citricoccus sp. I39-566]|uniref:S-layer homology domain-containing protein n=1 Tax=Citricoccus sp. I39-566 TaxID=3073268 RepID=UPI00286B74C4|nr:S-layer homology domain-containing protein [Citricoccus sp. I39-566]WMY77231.1 S-layer homology domain-containing protein [Citricoccus sp. I39-566]